MVFWVFGYGSLVWNPGFDYDEKMLGFIKDYRRVFDLGKFITSHHVGTSLDFDFHFCAYFAYTRCFAFLLLQHVLITEEHLKTLQELALWRRKKGKFA